MMLLSVTWRGWLAFAALAVSLSRASPARALDKRQSSTQSAWIGNPSFHHTNSMPWPAGNTNVLYRNVQDFGADPDGVSDSTDAFNMAIKGNGVLGVTTTERCAGGSEDMSSTTKPALVYVPPGTYKISSPIILYYMTSFYGDPLDPPTLLVDAGFSGRWVLDTNPYMDNGESTYVNQNNFYRQIRNLKIDMTAATVQGLAGIHWEVAQASSIQSIEFFMSDDDTRQQTGIFSENGSGGFMTDLRFHNGFIGATLGSQQYTSRNMTFKNTTTAISILWCWGWTFSGLDIQNAQIGINMSVLPQTIDSVVVLDSFIEAHVSGIHTAYDSSQAGNSAVNGSAGSLILERVTFQKIGVRSASDLNDRELTATGNPNLRYVQGAQLIGTSGNSAASSTSGTFIPNSEATKVNRQNMVEYTPKNGPLRATLNGAFYSRSKPQYETATEDDILQLSTMSEWETLQSGTGDASPMLSKAMQQAHNQNKILYVNWGAYLISTPIQVPPTLRMVGEMWPLFMIDGSSAAFNDAGHPNVVFTVGREGGEAGEVEISDLIITTKGPAAGAIAMKWNLTPLSGTCSSGGLWDVHMRIGGAAGTGLQVGECSSNNTEISTAGLNLESSDKQGTCDGVYLMFWASSAAKGLYIENAWFWVADHDIDDPNNHQLNIFSGRGVFIESQVTWLWATAAEHSALYNYQFHNAVHVFMGFLQTETPYFQPHYTAVQPFTPNATMSDPDWTICEKEGIKTHCIESWALRIDHCSNIQAWGLGLYSFFNSYDTACPFKGTCQKNLVHVLGAVEDIRLYAINTIGAENMVDYNFVSAAPIANFKSYLSWTIASWLSPLQSTW